MRSELLTAQYEHIPVRPQASRRTVADFADAGAPGVPVSDNRLCLRCRCGEMLKVASLYHGPNAGKCCSLQALGDFLRKHAMVKYPERLDDPDPDPHADPLHSVMWGDEVDDLPRAEQGG